MFNKGKKATEENGTAQPEQNCEAAVSESAEKDRYDAVCAERDALLAEIEKAKTEIKSQTEEAARARADYYNLRTRVERDRERDRKLAAEKSIEVLLPVYENLERVCGAVDDRESSVYKGMMMIVKQFLEAMCSLGLEPIPTEGAFDPALHEAVSMEPIEDESKDGHIIGALRKGYKLAGRVIRAPQVRVGKFTK